jgi:hypothetical protein
MHTRISEWSQGGRQREPAVSPGIVFRAIISLRYFWLRCYYTQLFDQCDELNGEKTHRSRLFVRGYVGKQYDFHPPPQPSSVPKPGHP